MNNMYDILNKMALLEGRGSKPDFLDLDKDGNKSEPMKSAAKDVDESALQAYLGKKKYGEAGMKALQKAGREGASKEKMASIKAKHDKMDEADMGEGNEFSGELAKAKATGAKEFRVDGKTYPVKEAKGSKPDFLDMDKDGNKTEPMKKAVRDKKARAVKESIRLVKEAQRGERRAQIYHDREYDEFTVCLSDSGHSQKFFTENSNEAVMAARTWLSEGKAVFPGTDEYKRRYGSDIESFRLRHAPSVMKDPEARKGLSKMDADLERLKKMRRGEIDPDELGDEPPAGEKRGRGRPKGSKRAIGAKGPSGKSKLLTREQDVAEGKLNEVTQGVEHSEWADNVKDAYHPTRVKIIKKRTEDGRHVKSVASIGDKLVGQYNMNTGVGTFTAPKKQGVSEDYDKDEYDEEGEMAKSQARVIADAADELQDILDDDENLPEWVQKKITLAKEYIDSARDYMKANPDEDDEDEDEDDEMVAEKAVSKAQRAAAGIAYAARKGDIPKSELRGASKEMADMPKKELKKFAKTKEKGLPEKVKEEGYVDPNKHPQTKDYGRGEDDRDEDKVDETTTSGSVATAPSTGKAKGIFGKGVYEARLAETFDSKIRAVMTESVNVTVNANSEGSNTVTVTGQDVAPDMLMDLLKMAGMNSAPEAVYQPVAQAPAGGADMMSGMLDTLDSISGEEQAIPEAAVCEVCGAHEGMHEAGCSREMAMEDELANSADNTETMSTDYMVNQLAGGLNGPKTQVNPNNMGDNPLAMPGLGKTAHSLNLGAVAEDVEQQLENRLMDLYKRIS